MIHSVCSYFMYPSLLTNPETLIEVNIHIIYNNSLPDILFGAISSNFLAKSSKHISFGKAFPLNRHFSLFGWDLLFCLPISLYKTSLYRIRLCRFIGIL